MNIEAAILDDVYECEELETITYYFTAPKERLKELLPTNNYPEAISMEISVEFPINAIEPANGSVVVSPTREDEYGSEDYDWTDVDLSYEDINKLIAIAKGEA